MIASNGRQAVDLMNETSVDLIITDLHMPILDGFGIIAFRNTMCPDVPLLVMTAEATPAIKDRLHKMGVARCIEKPFDLEELSAMVQAYLPSASVINRQLHEYAM